MFSSLYWERLDRRTHTVGNTVTVTVEQVKLCWYLLIQECKQVSHDNDHRPLKRHDYLLKLVSSFCTWVKLWNSANNIRKEEEKLWKATVSENIFPVMWLTGYGYEVEETLLGEQGAFQPPEIELKNACRRVDVMISLIIHQWVLSYTYNIQSLALPYCQGSCDWWDL